MFHCTDSDSEGEQEMEADFEESYLDLSQQELNEQDANSRDKILLRVNIYILHTYIFALYIKYF